MRKKSPTAEGGTTIAVMAKTAPATRKASAAAPASNLAQLKDVRVMVSMELGRTQKTVQEILDLGEQSLLELDRLVGEPIDIFINSKLFARGEVVTIGENFGVRVTEILGQKPEGE